MPSRSIYLHGSHEPLPEQIPLRAGPLSLLYENGDLRTIKLGETEILRRIYVAVRDRNWGTVASSLSNVKMAVEDESFSISYDAEHKQGEVNFFWRGSITGDSQGNIHFQMAGEARGTFQRNRIGFCVLHPMACAGVPVKIGHVDGSSEHTNFPQLIAPQLIKDGHPCPVAPFEYMRSLSHQVRPHLWATVRFEGDTFELEDQRNWTDASFKTYGTPLSLPFPVTVEAGTQIEQSIVLTLEGEKPSHPASPKEDLVTLTIHRQAGKPLPAIGLGMASHDQPLSEWEIARLQSLKLRHLRVDLPLRDADSAARLRQATTLAAALDVALEVALILSDSATEELAGLARRLAEMRPPICRWLVFHENEKTTAARWVERAREHLGAHATSSRFGGGSNAYFTEINAVRPETHNLDFITYSITPQVHAFDNRSLVETLEAQAETVKSAHQFADGKAIVVSPVTLLPRFNPNATGGEAAPKPGELPPQVDVRQMSLFGGAWTLGSLKHLCTSEVESVTYYETTGWRGVMETAAGSPLPQKFPSRPGMVFPLYYSLAYVGEFAEGEVIRVRSSHPLRVDGLALRRGSRFVVLLSNLTATVQQVVVKELSTPCRVRMLHESTFEAATQSPEEFLSTPGDSMQVSGSELNLTLPPYALVHVEG